MFEWTHCTSMSFAVDKWQRANKSKIEKPRYTIFINGWLRSIDNLTGLSDKVKTKFSRYSIIFKYLFLLNDDSLQESEKHHDEANAYLHIDALENDRKDKTINDNYYLITPHFLLHIVLYNNL